MYRSLPRSPPLATAVLGLALAACTLAPAVHAWEPDAEASPVALAAFHDQFASSAYFYPRHSAKPLGWIGFDVWADLAVTPDFEDEVETRDGTALTDDLPGGYLGIYRVGARKGLPGGFDIGAAFGKAYDSGMELLSGELSWAILDGGLAVPALGLRATGQRVTGDAYELRQIGAEVLISKGFAVLTPYAGAGYARSESTFDRAFSDLEIETDHGFVYGGVILNLWVPKITFEVEQGESLQGAVRVAIGL
jgi:hypothetical protein